MHANIEDLKIVPGLHIAVALEAIAIVAPNKGARIEWRLLNSGSHVVAQGMEEMSGDDYSKWGENDEYIYTWLAPRLGVKVKEVVDPAPVQHQPPHEAPAIEE
jgi:hypothetical protein